jgi:uncharacterized protein (DUF849 family)
MLLLFTLTMLLPDSRMRRTWFDVLGIGRTKLQTAHVPSLLPTHVRIGLVGIPRNRNRAEENLVLDLFRFSTTSEHCEI